MKIARLVALAVLVSAAGSALAQEIVLRWSGIPAPERRP